MNQALTDAVKKILPRSIVHRMLAWRAVSRGHNPELDLLPLLGKNGLFIDVGANIGDYSRVAAQHYKTVVAFEPQGRLVAKLRAELPDNAAVYPFALSDREVNDITLFIPVSNGQFITGLASLDPNCVLGYSDAMNVTRVSCDLRMLDSFDFHYVDTIKIDVEGFETSVVKGGIRTIRREKPAMIIEIENRHPTSHETFDILLDEGYKAYFYLDKTLFPVNPDSDTELNKPANGRFVNNFIFLHSYRHRSTMTEMFYDGTFVAPVSCV